MIAARRNCRVFSTLSTNSVLSPSFPLYAHQRTLQSPVKFGPSLPLLLRRANSDSDPFANGCYAACSGYARHAYRSCFNPAVARVLSTDFPDTGYPGEIGIKYVNDPSPFNRLDHKRRVFQFFFSFCIYPLVRFLFATWILVIGLLDQLSKRNATVEYLCTNNKFQRDYKLVA